MRKALLFVSLLFATACSLFVPRTDNFPQKSEATYFVVEGRFALKKGKENHSGRLRFSHEQTHDQLLLLTPFGQAVAELLVDQTGALLRLQDGRVFQAKTASELTERLLGFSLPLEEMSDWLLAKIPPGSAQQSNEAGQIIAWQSEPWQISYDYLEHQMSQEALPKGISVQKDDGFSLRLRIDDWQTL